MEKAIHQGRNVKRFREMLGIKQEALALQLGEDWNQRKISLLEQKEMIEPELLKEVCQALNVPPEAIKNFDTDIAINIVSTLFTSPTSLASQPNFNFKPIDKMVELYEALLKIQKEKIELLERRLAEKKNNYLSVNNKELLEEHFVPFHYSPGRCHELFEFN